MSLKIIFRNKKLECLCKEQAKATIQLGADAARKLRTRLSDIEAAECVTDLVAGRPHPLVGDRAGQFALELAGGCRLVFSPAHDPVPCRDDASIDWSQVTGVRIEFIGDYHD